MVLAADLRVERVRHPRRAVDGRLDLVRELLPARAPRRGAAALRAADAPGASEDERERDHARDEQSPSCRTGYRGFGERLDLGRRAAGERRDVPGRARSPRRSPRARAPAPRRGVVSGRSAIASLPAGTAASRSSTTSSGVSSSLGLGRREQEDLRVDAVERLLELLLVAHLDGAVEPELERCAVQLPRAGRRRRRASRRRAGTRRRRADASSSGTSARQRIGSERRLAHGAPGRADDERLRALRFRGSGGVRRPRPPR